MKIVRKIGLVIAASAVSLGAVAITAPAAQADTSWGWKIASR